MANEKPMTQRSMEISLIFYIFMEIHVNFICPVVLRHLQSIPIGLVSIPA